MFYSMIITIKRLQLIIYCQVDLLRITLWSTRIICSANCSTVRLRPTCFSCPRHHPVCAGGNGFEEGIVVPEPPGCLLVLLPPPAHPRRARTARQHVGRQRQVSRQQGRERDSPPGSPERGQAGDGRTHQQGLPPGGLPGEGDRGVRGGLGAPEEQREALWNFYQVRIDRTAQSQLKWFFFFFLFVLTWEPPVMFVFVFVVLVKSLRVKHLNGDEWSSRSSFHLHVAFIGDDL